MANETNDSYSLLVGLIFLFNLVLGTGVLTMPAVFNVAGYVLGIISIIFLCFVSYVQTTFLIESMANANFIKNFRNDCINETSTLLRSCPYEEYTDVEDEEIAKVSNTARNSLNKSSSTGSSMSHFSKLVNVDYLGTQSNAVLEQQDTSRYAFANQAFDDNSDQLEVSTFPNTIDNEHRKSFEKLTYLHKCFNLDHKFEIGNMTEIFLNRYLSKCFFASIVIYLFGDLIIYNLMMSKSLRDITCTSNSTELDDNCWDSLSISRHNVYRLYLLMFISILGPLTYAKIQKTKIIQILTIILRWIAFLSMIGITLKIFIKKENKGHSKVANFIELPKLFGICIYSFMCHHSVPSIITPIKNKKKIFLAIAVDYFIVMGFYLLIALTGIFAFEKIEDVYTLNFQQNSGDAYNPGSIPVFDIFLPTFPIFTLFSSYTVIALTLINNMKVLFNGTTERENNKLLQYSLPLVAIMPPLIIALFTEDVSSIVQYVGSYSGTLIQYVFPTLLVYYSRSKVKSSFIISFAAPDISTSNINNVYQSVNTYSSPFQSNFWVYSTAVWWVICIALVTLDHLRPLLHF